MKRKPPAHEVILAHMTEQVGVMKEIGPELPGSSASHNCLRVLGEVLIGMVIPEHCRGPLADSIQELVPEIPEAWHGSSHMLQGIVDRVRNGRNEIDGDQD